MQLSRYIDLASVAWTSSGPTVAEVDCGDCDGVLFIGVPGTTVARIPTLDIYYGASTAGYVQCSTAHTHSTTAAGNYVVCTDVYKPAARYVKGSLASTAEQAHYLLAFKYGLRSCLASTVGFSSTAGPYLSAVTGGIVRAVSPTSA